MLIHITGGLGSGKTLLATILAIDDDIDRNIYSNYKINSDRYIELTPEMLSTLYENSLILLDEAYTWLESRLSGRNINLYLTYILLQSRKRELDFIITDQIIGSIDVRFRIMTDYIIHCQNIIDKELIEKNNPKGLVGFLYSVFKCEEGFYRYKIGKYFFPYEDAKEYFKYFKTKEIVDTFDKSLLLNITKNKKPIIDEIEDCIQELINKYPVKNINKGIIADYCLLNDKPNIYIDMIYNRLRAKILEFKRKES